VTPNNATRPRRKKLPAGFAYTDVRVFVMPFIRIFRLTLAHDDVDLAVTLNIPADFRMDNWNVKTVVVRIFAASLVSCVHVKF
jgi:hypothetical protein